MGVHPSPLAGLISTHFNLYHHQRYLQDVPTTFTNEKSGQTNPWKYGQSFQVPFFFLIRWQENTHNYYQKYFCCLHCSLFRCSDRNWILENWREPEYSTDNLQLTWSWSATVWQKLTEKSWKLLDPKSWQKSTQKSCSTQKVDKSQPKKVAWPKHWIQESNLCRRVQCCT